MDHLAILDAADPTAINGKNLQRRASGQFFTHELIGRHLAAAIAGAAHTKSEMSIIDPFGGDARLIAWLLPELTKHGVRSVHAAAWEHDPAAAASAARTIEDAAAAAEVQVEVEVWVGDTFSRAAQTNERFDLVITNPPWELLKPDHRELRRLPSDLREDYVGELRAFDQRLIGEYPISQPSRRFAGWGTNLSRVGTEVALRITADDGVCGVVCPSSLLADNTSGALRRWMFERFALVDVAHWPAEARLFDKIDVPCLSFVALRGAAQDETRITRIGASRTVSESATVRLGREWLESHDFAVPVQYGAEGIHLLKELDRHPRFESLEGRHREGLWAGRELDETGRARFIRDAGEHPFVRSLHIRRLSPPRIPEDEFVDIGQRAVPASAGYQRLAWRDISRPSQKRRIHASLLPPGPVTGNSVSVAYFRDGDLPRLLALLGIVSSLPFEFQVRSLLMTNHVSLSAMRAARLPALTPKTTAELARGAYDCLTGQSGAEAKLEAMAATVYGLDFDTWVALADRFALDEEEREQFELAWAS